MSERYRLLLESIDAIVWERELSTRRLTYMSWAARGVLGYPVERMVDITARKEREAASAAIVRCQEAILESAGEGIDGLDASGQTTFVNSAAERILGSGAAELIGKPQHESIHHHRVDGTPYPVEECPIYSTLRDGKVAPGGRGRLLAARTASSRSSRGGRERGGRGSGFPSRKGFAELLWRWLEVSSSVGEGSTFRLVLPPAAPQ